MRTESAPDEHRSEDAVTEMPAGLRRADTASSATSAGLSVVCMASMATAFAATGTAAGAGAAGVSGMAAMGSGSALSVLPVIFEAVGLGALNYLPNVLLQPLLIVSLDSASARRTSLRAATGAEARSFSAPRAPSYCM